MPLNEVSFDNWHVGEVLTSQKGARCAPINDNGKPMSLQLTSIHDPLSSPFGISSFGPEETIRKSLELRCSLELETFLQRLDAWVRAYLQDNAERLFKGKAIEYRDCLQLKGEYPSPVRCKLNTAGTMSFRCWGLDKQRIDMPEDLRAPAALVPIAQAKSLWIMHNEVGITLECTDLMCRIPEGPAHLQRTIPSTKQIQSNDGSPQRRRDHWALG